MEELLLTTKFDEVIKNNLPHINNYPEMLPFIGANYEKMKHRIFILGESHYIDDTQIKKLKEGERFLTDDWYTKNSLEFNPTMKQYITTRDNLKSVEANKITPPLRSYSNLRKELKVHVDLFDQDKVFSNFVYFNYFQRPENKSGESICNTDVDNKKAYQTLLFMANLLQPNKIIFATTKGFEAFTKSNISSAIAMSCKLDFVPHASSIWWNRASRKYKMIGNEKMKGKDKFIALLKSELS